MIVDSSALPEQVVRDVIRSAFYSAGQRCSAVRVLYVQDSIADRVISLLKGAMATLNVGDPAELETDVGPLISRNAKADLEVHAHVLEVQGRMLCRAKITALARTENLMAPVVLEIDSINDLQAEHFGPILHVIRFSYGQVDQVVDDINGYGFGLTCGIHSRNQAWANNLADKLNVGNIYINRDTVAAIVGTQPFGGHGLSGTGFKAGGRNYLLRFLKEKTITNNLSAIGGDVDLVAPKKT